MLMLSLAAQPLVILEGILYQAFLLSPELWLQAGGAPRIAHGVWFRSGKVKLENWRSSRATTFSTIIFWLALVLILKPSLICSGSKKNRHSFPGGLDAGLLRPWHIDLLKSIRLKRLYFACDTIEALPILEQAADLLADFSRNLKFCYVLVGSNGEALEQAEERLIKVFSLGFMPFAMLYRGLDSKMRPHPDPEWRKMIRKWTAPGRYRAFMRDELGWKGE